MKHRNKLLKRVQKIHYLNDDGMLVCNPRDREASHRAENENIATDKPNYVTCKKCYSILHKKLKEEHI